MRREDGVIPPLSEGGFFLKIEIGEFIFVMGTNSKPCFLGGMGRKSLVVFQNGLVGFFNFS